MRSKIVDRFDSNIGENRSRRLQLLSGCGQLNPDRCASLAHEQWCRFCRSTSIKFVEIYIILNIYYIFDNIIDLSFEDDEIMKKFVTNLCKIFKISSNNLENDLFLKSGRYRDCVTVCIKKTHTHTSKKHQLELKFCNNFFVVSRHSF